MPEANEFDIYRSASGYVAVTNEVRRAILAALAKKERELPDLVKITGKAKPTLSNLHMRELLQQGLIEERPHATDARRKIYRLKGERIGSSSVPIETLRGAVKQYVSQSPLAHAIPLQQVLDVLLAAKSAEALRRQGVKLGEIAAPLFSSSDTRELLQRVAGYWEREGITRTLRIDLEAHALDLDVNPRYAESKEMLKLTAILLAGFLQGILAKLEMKGSTSGETIPGDRVRVAVSAA